MKSSTKDKSYGDWRNAVDERLQEIYCITIEDAGVDEDYLIKHWQSDEAAFEFVEWYATSMTLIR
jgi:hypothetical protein